MEEDKKDKRIYKSRTRQDWQTKMNNNIDRESIQEVSVPALHCPWHMNVCKNSEIQNLSPEEEWTADNTSKDWQHQMTQRNSVKTISTWLSLNVFHIVNTARICCDIMYSDNDLNSERIQKSRWTPSFMIVHATVESVYPEVNSLPSDHWISLLDLAWPAKQQRSEVWQFQ